MVAEKSGREKKIVDVHIGGGGGKTNVDASGQGGEGGGVKKSDFVWTS